jgi:serine/threonine protein kinase
MNEQATCPECGKPLPEGSSHGLCPACLMGQVMASQTLNTMAGNEATTPPPTPEEIADKFPQFEVVECLGRGGMGVVYKARQKSLDRWVAIKLLAPERVHEELFAEHFEREAKTLARLNHPNIVTVFDHGEADGVFYIVMEFVDGVNLRDLLMEGKMEPAQALAIVPEICAALQFAHDKGVVHRDIKPENILIDRDGRVKIADFGIAALVGTDADHSGTPPYMAPEQESVGGTIDHRADIYALGVVFYEMLTGERPDKDLVAPSRKVEIDVRIDELVLRALEREPERRYQTAGEFRTVVQTMAATVPSNSNSHVESQSEKFPDDGRKSQAGPRLNLAEHQRRPMLWYGFTVSLIGLPAGLALNLPLVWGLSIAGILISGMRLGLVRAFQRHLRQPTVASSIAEATSPNRPFVIVGRRGNRSAIHWPGVVLVFFIILVVVQTGGALFCLALGTPMDARAVMIGFLSAVMAIGIGLARARTVPVERLVDLNKTATSKPDEAAGSPASLKPRATPGPFRRFRWLFLGILILGPLIGAVTGLGRILPKGEDVLHTVVSVFNVKGAEREIKAAGAQVTSPSTLDVVSRQLDLAHKWNCETDEVASRLRQLILVEPIVNTNLIQVKVHQVRRSPEDEAARIADAIRVALVDQPEGPAISLMGSSYERPSKIESALPVAIGAVLGLVLSPLLAMLVMMSLHRLFPPPQPRWWAVGIAGVLVIALLVSLGIGIKFLHEIRTANLVHIPRGPVRSESLETPEHAARSFMEAKTLQQYAHALMIYQESTESFPPDLATLLDGDFPGKKRWENLQKDGLMLNHQTGKMERPIYHGHKDLRANDHDVAKFILVAAPSADPQRKRLVGYLDGSVKIIDEAEYRKQLQKQPEAAAPQPGEVKRLPPIFGELKLTESQEQAIRRWLAQQGGAANPAKLANFVKSTLRDDQRAAFQRMIEQGQQPDGQNDQPTTVAAVVQSLAKKLSGITTKYPELATYKEAEANRGDSLFYSQNFVEPTGQKRGIKDSDFGKDGCFIGFSTAPIPPKDRVHPMTPPTLELENLGLYLWAEIRTGATPSNGFQKEIEELLHFHAEMLKAMDSKKRE